MEFPAVANSAALSVAEPKSGETRDGRAIGQGIGSPSQRRHAPTDRSVALYRLVTRRKLPLKSPQVFDGEPEVHHKHHVISAND